MFCRMNSAVTTHTRCCLSFLLLLVVSISLIGYGCAWIGSQRQSRTPGEEISGTSFYQAQRLYEAGQFQQAMALWERVPSSDPHYVDAQLGIREARLQIEQLQQEHRISNRARSQIDAYIAQAEELEQRGDLTAAVQQYEEARKLDPQNIVLYNKIEELHALLDDTLERYAKLGDVYLAQGEYEKSKAEWERLLFLEPDNERAQQRLADIEVLTATSDTVFVTRGRSLFEKGLVNAARNEFEKARRVNPANELTVTYLAKLDDIPYTEYQVKKGDTLSSIAMAYSGKVSYFQILADFNTLDVNIPLKIGHIIKIPHILEFRNSFAPNGSEILLESPAGEGEQQIASRTLPSEDAFAPETDEALEQTMQNGLAAFQEGDYRQAIELLQQVLLRDPENEQAYEYFVEATEYIRRRRFSVESPPASSPETPVTEDLEKPEMSEAQRLTNEALALRDAGDFKQALALFEQAYQRDPTLPGLLEKMEETRDALKQQVTSYLNEGIKFFNQDALEEAILAWKKVLELDPANRQAVEYKERAETLLNTISSQ